MLQTCVQNFKPMLFDTDSGYPIPGPRVIAGQLYLTNGKRQNKGTSVGLGSSPTNSGAGLNILNRLSDKSTFQCILACS